MHLRWIKNTLATVGSAYLTSKVIGLYFLWDQSQRKPFSTKTLSCVDKKESEKAAHNEHPKTRSHHT